jgi:hypothetical protein
MSSGLHSPLWEKASVSVLLAYLTSRGVPTSRGMDRMELVELARGTADRLNETILDVCNLLVGQNPSFLQNISLPGPDGQELCPQGRDSLLPLHGHGGNLSV